MTVLELTVSTEASEASEASSGDTVALGGSAGSRGISLSRVRGGITRTPRRIHGHPTPGRKSSLVSSIIGVSWHRSAGRGSSARGTGGARGTKQSCRACGSFLCSMRCHARQLTATRG